jgi:tetratricopeptide (TPR) repeat protein
VFVGLYQLALEKYMKSLDLLQNQSYCHNIHPKIAEIENEVGLMAIDLCNFNLASKCLENALEIRETVFAANHPAVGQSYCSKGRLLVAQGRYIEALKFFEKSLTIRAQYYTIHPDLGETLHFLGQIRSAHAMTPSQPKSNINLHELTQYYCLRLYIVYKTLLVL